MPTPTVETKERGLRALKEAEAVVALLSEESSAEARKLIEEVRSEARQLRGEMRALVIGLLADEPLPIAFYKPWASGPRIREWRDDGHILCEMRNGKVTCKPSDFFKYFRSLKDEGKRGRKRAA